MLGKYCPIIVRKSETFDVIVLGAGPTGICLAKLLTKLFPKLKIKVPHLQNNYYNIVI